MEAVWKVEMLGTLRAVHEDSVVNRFRTRRVALLLAHLAFYRSRLHFRDEVGEMLWPDGDPEVVRRNLRQALTSLRHVLEPPPLPRESILQVQQSRLRLNPELVTTDVEEFEQVVSLVRRKATAAEQMPLLKRAVALYQGELLPGYDEDWILQERLRLEDLYVFALRRLVEHCRELGSLDEAIQYARLALEKERFNEGWHVALMRLYLDSGRPASAVKQYEDLEEQLQENLDAEPGDIAEGLLERARRALASGSTPPPDPVSPLPPSEDEPALPELEPVSTVVRLPIQLTRFCGRQEELESTVELFLAKRARLATLLGPAGTGKTRLSVEVGRRLADTGVWNVWFVPLADVASGTVILDAVLDTLKARRSAQDPFEVLRDATRDRENVLLILDNLEHIVEDAAPIIGQIVERVPGIQVLVTSRQILRLGVEHQIPVPPLPIPFERGRAAAADAEELAQLAAFPSIQLFVDRCQTVRPDFQLTLHNARAVTTICEQLEGVPLAIELAAGLSGSFAPAQMVFHLQKRLTALSTRRRDMPVRHRSLRAAIDYSYDTLSPELQRFFSALSVFRGGFNVEAAYEVCYRNLFSEAAEPTSVRRHPHDGCLDLVLELQERSLLRSEGSDEEQELRFRMLESFREYAEEHLDENEYRDLRRRHARFFRERPPKLAYSASVEERTRRHLWIESEFDNYIAALDFTLGEGDLAACVELLSTLATTWTSRGPRVVERSYIRRIADRPERREIDPASQIFLLRMLGTTLIRSTEYAAAHRVCEEALKIAEASGDQEQVAICYSAISTCAGYMGNLSECLELNQRVLELAPDNLSLLERAYIGIGAVYWGRGEIENAEAAYLQAYEVSTRLRGEPETLVLCNLARTALDLGRYDEAMIRLGDALRICRRLHDEFGQAMCLSLVSRYHWLKENLPAAISTGREALLRFRDFDFSHFSLSGIHQQSLILASMGEWEPATTLLAATRGIGRMARVPDERDHEAAVETIRKHLSPLGYERAWAKGLTMDTEEAFRLALRFK